MKNRRLKTRTPISNAIDTQLLVRLKELAAETRVPMSKLLDEAIEDLLKKYKK